MESRTVRSTSICAVVLFTKSGRPDRKLMKGKGVIESAPKTQRDADARGTAHAVQGPVADRIAHGAAELVREDSHDVNEQRAAHRMETQLVAVLIARGDDDWTIGPMEWVLQRHLSCVLRLPMWTARRVNDTMDVVDRLKLDAGIHVFALRWDGARAAPLCGVVQLCADRF